MIILRDDHSGLDLIYSDNFPIEFLDMVILHEMAHLKYLHHRKSFWAHLSVLLNDDAKQQKELRDIVLSKYADLYDFLMK